MVRESLTSQYLVKENRDADEHLSALTSISSSWYSTVGGFPSLFGFSIMGFRTTLGVSWKYKQQIKRIREVKLSNFHS